MAIYGNVNTANKFYIINSNGSIEWVPSLSIAKKYNNNPAYTEWFQKDIYATNEELVVNSKGLTVLKSQYDEEQLKKSKKTNSENFKQQAEEYLKAKLLEYSTSKGYESFYTLISWKNSSIKQYKEEATAALKYRDKAYEYMFDFFNNILINFLDNQEEGSENIDLSEIYDKYINNFPLF